MPFFFIFFVFDFIYGFLFSVACLLLCFIYSLCKEIFILNLQGDDKFGFFVLGVACYCVFKKWFLFVKELIEAIKTNLLKNIN